MPGHDSAQKVIQMDIRNYQKEFPIHHAVARMVGIDTFSVKLTQIKARDGAFDVVITSGNPQEKPEGDSLNNPWWKIEEEIYLYSCLLTGAIEAGQLVASNFKGELSQINFNHAKFSKSDITALLKNKGINDKFFNPAP